jgi:hypothetical protein
MRERSIRTRRRCTLVSILLLVIAGCSGRVDHAVEQVGREPVIDPDYSGTVIPPNIAPLNFMVNEKGTSFRVLVFGDRGDTIRVKAGRFPARIILPSGKWKKLLQNNRGAHLTMRILAKKDGKWRRFDPIVNTVATEEIDNFLLYRKIFGFRNIPDMAIMQRDLRSFAERTVLNNRTISTRSLACINCHSFCPTDPERMIVHMRGKQQGMLLVSGRNAVKIDTRTKFNKGPASYASWHPSGTLLAFAVMKVNQMLHSTGDPRVVNDEASDLILYDVDRNLISTNPKIADPKRMETLPEWSPDGQYLYFCSAPQPENVDQRFYTELKFREVRYDLMRIPFDIATRSWGEPETLLCAKETNLSNVHPKVSPDGRFLLFVTMPYSYFAVYDDSSDLCLMDLATKSYRRLDKVNSVYAESYHTWSSNSRWFVMTSRRRDGMCGYPYFVHVDSSGNESKPFLLPQKDPRWYETNLKSFNVPVLVKESVQISWRTLSNVAGDTAHEIPAELDGKVPLDGMTGASAK